MQKIENGGDGTLDKNRWAPPRDVLPSPLKEVCYPIYKFNSRRSPPQHHHGEYVRKSVQRPLRQKRNANPNLNATAVCTKYLILELILNEQKNT